MGIRSEAGFTVIETILFLAITSALILVMIAATGASLNVQRYRDSVESFKSLLQQQYTSLSNVQNGRDNDWSCTPSAQPIEDSATPQDRGQSTCILVGKYMRIDRGAITTYTVLAHPTSTSVAADTPDLQAMRTGYVMNIAPDSAERQSMEWGTQIAWAREGTLDQNGSPTPRTMGILFIRSPFSGQVHTFTSDTIPAEASISAATFNNMINAARQNERMVCVGSTGLLTGDSSGIYMSPSASTINSIEMRTNDSEASAARGIKC